MSAVARRRVWRRAADMPLADMRSESEELAAPVAYVGLVTRLLAFGVDAAVINGVAVVVGAIFALAFSVLNLPHELEVVAAAIGGVAYVLWAIGYFVTFWATTGQTPGNRLLRIRVQTADGRRLLPRRALVRFGGLILAALPLFAGYLMILVTDRRRGLQDILARTVVVEAPREDRPQGRGRPVRADGP
jgi:uncharacterized RDD family membrane protein YckC